MATVIELENVDTIYEGEQLPAIYDVTLTIDSDEFVCIVGPNGAGKTTLLETVNGLLPATRGTVRVFQQSINSNGTSLRARIGYTPQGFSVDPGTPFLVRQVVMMGRYGRVGLLRSPSSEDAQVVDDAIELMGIKDLIDRPVGKLSGGQLQKVLLARAIAKDPDLLLLDECFSNLDPKSKMKTLQILEFLHEERGLPILVVTHSFLPLLDVCDRVIGLRDGYTAMDIPRPDESQKQLLREGNLIS
jgi:zinc/manganese transport system ATP-binding protein